MRNNALYTILFSAAVCIVCSLLVSTSAVVLQERQERNAQLEKQRSVLIAAGLATSQQRLSPEQVEKAFESIEAVIIDLKSGEETDMDPDAFDQQVARKDPDRSEPASDNEAGLQRVANHAKVYKVIDNGAVDTLVLPVRGKGLWSTLWGFLAMDSDGRTIHGITFYQHGETPGLGGEIDNPKWKQRWGGRKAVGPDGTPKIVVIKGQAGPPEDDPYQVDGLSGATLTSRGVSHLVRFWVGEHGFGPYLAKYRNNGSASQ